MENEPVVTRPGTRTSAGAAVALVLSALVYVLSETVTARAWSIPAYSYSANCAVLLVGRVLQGRTRAVLLAIGAGTTLGFVLWQLLVGGFLLHVTQPVRLLLGRRSRGHI